MLGTPCTCSVFKNTAASSFCHPLFLFANGVHSYNMVLNPDDNTNGESSCPNTRGRGRNPHSREGWKNKGETEYFSHPDVAV
mmetsp:Transcript_16405/g.25502  ORF Transcript_16405/g.25502 Transcript_16405/m.25502 type:complete len:82 (+) Transcript_16405:229-474(+)